MISIVSLRLRKKLMSGMVVHSSNPSPLEATAGIREFEVSLGHITIFCLKSTKNE
jgi:hypothetical protein